MVSFIRLSSTWGLIRYFSEAVEGISIELLGGKMVLYAGHLDGIKGVKGDSDRVQASLFLCRAESGSGTITWTGVPG